MAGAHSVGRAHPRRPIPAERKRKQSRVGELVGSAPCVGMASCSLLSWVKAPGNQGGQNDQGTPVWSELMNERQGTAHSRARLCDLGRGEPPRRTSRGALAASGTRNRASAEVSGGTSRRGTRAAYPYGEDRGNQCPERAIRGIAVGRRNWTFAGSDAGGRRAAALYTLIETAKLNDVDAHAWLADVLTRLPDHPAQRLHELLPWAWKTSQLQQAAA